MNSRYAQLLPPSLGGNAFQATVDGFQVNASFALTLVSIGAATRSTNTQMVKPIYSQSRQAYVGLAVYNAQAASNGVAFIGAGSLGYIPAGSGYTPGVGITFNAEFAALYQDGGARLGAQEGYSNFLSEKTAQIIGFIHGWDSSGQVQPQTLLSADAINTLRNNLETALADSDCGKFLKALLLNLPAKNWRTEKYDGTLLEAFDRVKTMGGFWSKAFGSTLDDVTIAGQADEKIVGIYFNSATAVPLIMSEKRWQQLGATMILIHELVHLFVKEPVSGPYDHTPMALAAQKAAASVGINAESALSLKPSSINNDPSGYFDKVLKYACRKVK